MKKESKKVVSADYVNVPSAAFTFCRYSVAIIIWIALFLRLEWLVSIAFLILLVSALVGVEYSPMILIYSYTLDKIFTSKKELLNKKAMRFAHSLGTILAGIAVLLLYTGVEKVGWGFVFFLAIMKTISAVGLCPAYKLYECTTSGGCCSFSKKLIKND